MQIGDYMSFLEKLKKRARRDSTYIDRLKRRGTLDTKVGYLFTAADSLKKRENIHLLLMAYWTVFDSVDDYSRILVATPAESITRTRRLLLERTA